MEQRKDPLTRSWVLVGDDELPESPSQRCPYCDGSQPTGPVIFYLPGRDGSWGTRVFPHPRPIYLIEGGAQRAAEGIYDRMRTLGAHEVIIESPDHNMQMWNAPVDSVERVLLTYAHRIQDLKGDRRFRYVTVFKNAGAPAGEEISHPYSELTATTFIPRRLMYELASCREYWQLKERCVFCDIVQQELQQQKRVVEATPNFVSFCPFAPRVPYEVWIAPRYHRAAFESDLPQSGRARELAELLQRSILRLRTITDSFHMVLHTTPNTLASSKQDNWSTLDDDYHWHFEIMPIVEKKTKSYSIKEVYFCPVSPEHAASVLRDIFV